MGNSKMKYLRKQYAVPAKREMTVQIYRKMRKFTEEGGFYWKLIHWGRISSCRRGSQIYVDGKGPYHCRDGVVYFDEKNRVILDTRVNHGGADPEVPTD